MQLALLPPQPGVEFDEPSHRYRVWSPRRGAWLMPYSVSQILTVSGLKSFDTAPWKAKLIRDGMSAVEAEAFMRRHTSHRAQVGTDFHHLVERTLLRGECRYVEEESISILNTWVGQFLPRIGRVLVIESPMVHRQWFYAGTPDLVAEVDGQWTICDWKTKQSAEKAKPSSEWIYQLAAYRELIRNQYGLEVNWALNHMCWDGGGKDVRWNRADLLHGWASFKDAINVHHQQRAAECPDHAAWINYHLSH